VFAGAAREAVFSNRDVIRRVHADFVPVALKAGLVNNPPNDEEGRLYREIGRSKPAPQGICVVNSAGKVLDWALMFDDDESVLAFLDHSLKRFAEFPDAKKPVPAERYMSFPSAKLPDIEDTGKVPLLIEHHPEGKRCPAMTPVRPGTLLVRVYGRALDEKGKPLADTVSQDRYVEDRFHVPVGMQEALAKELAAAGPRRFRLAEDLARLLVSHAFLGQLDVNPLGSIPGDQSTLKQCEFWAEKVRGDDEPVRLRIGGTSEAEGGSSAGQNGDGRRWQHAVRLTWEGMIEMERSQVSRLLLIASGSEKLKWGNQNQQLKNQAEVSILPGGHVIDLRCGVRYGIIGEPVAADQAGGGDLPVPEHAEILAEARKQLIDALGGPFIVFHAKVQEDLKLADAQKREVLEQLPDYLQETAKVFEKLQDETPPERERAVQDHRRKSEAKLTALLKHVLDAKQQERLFQLQLQQAGPFALLGPNPAFARLKITDEQRKRFMTEMETMQEQIQRLIKELESGGNPEEIMPKIMKARKAHEGRIEIILTDAQKERWREMLGKPLDLGE
jgi:hypothetical protein